MRCRDAEGDARHRTLEWLQWVELEIDNIRSALQRCLATSDWRRGLELATSIGYYWVTRGTTESMRWFDELLDRCGGSSRHPGTGLSLPGMAEHAPDRARGGQAMAGPSHRGGPEPRASSPQLSESLSTASTAENMAGNGAAARQLLDEAEALAPRVAFLLRVDRADPGQSHSRVLRGRS